jgi:hypothetical protein
LIADSPIERQLSDMHVHAIKQYAAGMAVRDHSKSTLDFAYVVAQVEIEMGAMRSARDG